MGGSTGSLLGTIIGGTAGFFVGGPAGAMAGASMGGAVGSSMDKPDVPNAPMPNAMEQQLGNVVGAEGGKTLDLTEQDKQRGSISKKRLGTKQLQIPLANQASAGVNVAPTQGVNV